MELFLHRNSAWNKLRLKIINFMNINLVENVFIEYDNVMAAFVTNSVYLIELTVSKKKTLVLNI